jgi:anti-anti-sigma factor
MDGARITSSIEDGVSVVELLGEQDIAGGSALRAALERSLASGGNVVVDVSRLGFLDAATLAGIVRLDREARRLGQRIVLQTGGAAAVVARVLEICEAAALIDCAADRHTALRLARRRAA